MRDRVTASVRVTVTVRLVMFSVLESILMYLNIIKKLIEDKS